VRLKSEQGQAGVDVFRISVVRPWRSLVLPWRIPNIMCASMARKAKLAYTFFASPWCDRGDPWRSPDVFPTYVRRKSAQGQACVDVFSHFPGATVAFPGAPLPFSQHHVRLKSAQGQAGVDAFRISLV
jgi:hypothetical protein